MVPDGTYWPTRLMLIAGSAAFLGSFGSTMTTSIGGSVCNTSIDWKLQSPIEPVSKVSPKCAQKHKYCILQRPEHWIWQHVRSQTTEFSMLPLAVYVRFVLLHLSWHLPGYTVTSYEAILFWLSSSDFKFNDHLSLSWCWMTCHCIWYPGGNKGIWSLRHVIRKINILPENDFSSKSKTARSFFRRSHCRSRYHFLQKK